MLRRLLFTIVAVICCVAASAQGTCVINGNIADSKLVDGKKIKKVFLTRTDEQGCTHTVAESKVKKGKYTFEYKLAKDEPVLMYMITGFGEGQGIELFIEDGQVTVNTAKASQPCGTVVGGTPTNDDYSAFKSVLNEGFKAAEEYPCESMKYREAIKRLSHTIRFLIDHNDSPMTPLAIERHLLHLLSPSYADQMLKSVAASLHNHPYYLSLHNKVLSGSLKVGNIVPDIQLPLLGGEKKQLSDFRGKYVVLNFWANGCGKSAQMLDEIQNLYDIVKDNKEQFVIVSFALENDAAAWESAVNSNNMVRDGWLNACDCMGADSPAAKLLGVDKAPRIIIVEPEGRAVTLDMDVDELIIRVEQILSGDLYYLDKEE